MPQVLKDEVEERIRTAALEVFAERGYAAASMAEIARRASISAGNIYRYFPAKKALFAAVLPAAVPRRFLELLGRRMRAAREEENLSLTGPGSSYPVAAQATVDYALDHRAEAVILLSRAAGTAYANLAEQVVELLVREALEYVWGMSPTVAITPPLRFDLEEIYRSYVRAWARILERFPQVDEARQALAAYERYHLAGLRALFA